MPDNPLQRAFCSTTTAWQEGNSKEDNCVLHFDPQKEQQFLQFPLIMQFPLY